MYDFLSEKSLRLVYETFTLAIWILFTRASILSWNLNNKMTMDISIIIPVINEERIINQTLERLRSAKTSGTFEIIVVDGNVSGNTLRAITKKNIIKIKSPCGRGAQMNTGARAAKGHILLFLHADTILPKNAIDSAISACRLKRIVGGAFDLGIESERPG
jgi:glycosyltransferase involved in cell wall biosynthesis